MIGSQLDKKTFELINEKRLKDYGKNYVLQEKDFLESYFFLVKEKGKIVSFGVLEPITISYEGKHYEIYGIGKIMSVVKGGGYGSILMKEMKKFLKKKKKTGLGFSGGKTMEFYKKCGYKTIDKFGRRFALRNPDTEEIKFEAEDDIGDGLYIEGKDKLISIMLKGKATGYYYLPYIKNPHW